MPKGLVKVGDVEYFNIPDYMDYNYPFQIFIGGRTGGKTYSMLKWLILEAQKSGKPFIFSRRLKTDLEEMVDTKEGYETGNVIKSLNDDMGWNYGIDFMTKKMAGIFHRETDEEDGSLKSVGAPIAYAIPMGSIARMKGIDMHECDDWLYDEFIPEPHIPKIRNEGEMIFRAYETVARNREIKGQKPIRFTMLANAEDIYHAIFQTLGVVADMEKLMRTGKEHKYYPDRGLAVHILKTPESLLKKKEGTALYRLTQGTKYYDMALNNQFAYNDFSDIKYMRLDGFRPVCSLDKAYIYEKKGERIYYVSYAPAKCESFNTKTQNNAMYFRRRIGVMLHDPYIEGRIFFESYDLKMHLLDNIL